MIQSFAEDKPKPRGVGVQQTSLSADTKLAEFVSEAKQANPEVDDALVNAALGGDIEAVKLHLAVG